MKKDAGFDFSRSNTQVNFILLITLACIMSVNIFPGCQVQSEEYRPGLIGIYYSEPNFTSIKAITILTSLEQNWNEEVDFETGSSGVWNGYIIAPVDGDISFHLETNKIATLAIGKDHQTESNQDQASTTLVVQMEKNRIYPIRVTFINGGQQSDYGYFNIKWHWDKQDLTSIPVANIKHSDQNLADLAWLSELDEEPVDKSQFLTVPGKHVIVYYEPGRFAAWPANNGIWNWGDEILVGFLRAFYKENKYHHSIDRTKPSQSVLARSLDGGETWIVEDPENYIGDGSDFVDLKNEINFTNPNLAMRFTKKGFFTSYTRGKSWDGPFKFPNFKVGEITTRTDYIVNGQKNCLFFLSAKDKSVKATLQDRSFCAQTTDGGKTIKFISWMAETDTIRSVMSSTVRMSKSHLITALRRRYDPTSDQKTTLPKNYIDVHESLDNGKTWNFLHKIAETDRGMRNGNPPSLVKLPDGRICVTYGYRNIPYSIRARISADKGKTWSKEILLRDDARKFDIGYTQSVVREDGNIVTLYYYTTEAKKEMHIAATIWDPDNVK